MSVAGLCGLGVQKGGGQWKVWACSCRGVPLGVGVGGAKGGRSIGVGVGVGGAKGGGWGCKGWKVWMCSCRGGPCRGVVPCNLACRLGVW